MGYGSVITFFFNSFTRKHLRQHLCKNEFTHILINPIIFELIFIKYILNLI